MRRFLPLISCISTAVMISSACYADTGTTTGSVCIRETPGGGGIAEGGRDSAGMARQEKLGGATAPLPSTLESETKVITAVSAKSSVFEVTQEPTAEETRAQYEPRLAQAKARVAQLESQLTGIQKDAARMGKELIAAKKRIETLTTALREAEKAGAEAKRNGEKLQAEILDITRRASIKKIEADRGAEEVTRLTRLLAEKTTALEVIVSGTEYDEPALGLVTVSREPGRVVVAVAASTEGVADARFYGAVRVKQRAGDGRVVYTLDPAKMKAI